MERVLSFREPGGCGQSVYIRKRLCISIVFVVGFVSIFGGYLIGRLSMKNEYLLKTYKDMKKESAVDSIIDNFGNLTKVIETVILLSEHLEDTTQNYNDIVQVLNSVPNKDIVYKLENRTHGVVKLISEAIVKKCNTFQAFVYNLQLYLQKETL